MNYSHVSVMPDEVLFYLDPKPGGIYVDGTMGGGGHTRAIAERILPDGRVIAVDQDPDAIDHVRSSLPCSLKNIEIVWGNFSDLAAILAANNLSGVDGIVLDLGISFYHLQGSARGFSFLRDEPLDMRMNPSHGGTTAADLVNTLSEKELTDLFHRYGEERHARRIARGIIAYRQEEPITSSLVLANIAKTAVPKQKGKKHRHEATLIFQALRIAVNDELGHLERFLDNVTDCLRPGGRVVVISFHSLEDRMVKRRFVSFHKGCTCPPGLPVCGCGNVASGRLLNRKVVVPSAEEIASNPLSRSARLRAFEKY